MNYTDILSLTAFALHRSFPRQPHFHKSEEDAICQSIRRDPILKQLLLLYPPFGPEFFQMFGYPQHRQLADLLLNDLLKFYYYRFFSLSTLEEEEDGDDDEADLSSSVKKIRETLLLYLEIFKDHPYARKMYPSLSAQQTSIQHYCFFSWLRVLHHKIEKIFHQKFDGMYGSVILKIFENFFEKSGLSEVLQKDEIGLLSVQEIHMLFKLFLVIDGFSDDWIGFPGWSQSIAQRLTYFIPQFWPQSFQDYLQENDPLIRKFLNSVLVWLVSPYPIQQPTEYLIQSYRRSQIPFDNIKTLQAMQKDLNINQHHLQLLLSLFGHKNQLFMQSTSDYGVMCLKTDFPESHLKSIAYLRTPDETFRVNVNSVRSSSIPRKRQFDPKSFEKIATALITDRRSVPLECLDVCHFKPREIYRGLRRGKMMSFSDYQLVSYLQSLESLPDGHPYKDFTYNPQNIADLFQSAIKLLYPKTMGYLLKYFDITRKLIPPVQVENSWVRKNPVLFAHESYMQEFPLLAEDEYLLHEAVMMKQYSTLAILLKRGHPCHVLNDDGDSALDIATHSYDRTAISIFFSEFERRKSCALDTSDYEGLFTKSLKNLIPCLFNLRDSQLLLKVFCHFEEAVEIELSSRFQISLRLIMSLSLGISESWSTQSEAWWRLNIQGLEKWVKMNGDLQLMCANWKKISLSDRNLILLKLDQDSHLYSLGVNKVLRVLRAEDKKLSANEYHNICWSLHSQQSAFRSYGTHRQCSSYTA